MWKPLLSSLLLSAMMLHVNTLTTDDPDSSEEFTDHSEYPTAPTSPPVTRPPIVPGPCGVCMMTRIGEDCVDMITNAFESIEGSNEGSNERENEGSNEGSNEGGNFTSADCITIVDSITGCLDLLETNCLNNSFVDDLFAKINLANLKDLGNYSCHHMDELVHWGSCIATTGTLECLEGKGLTSAFDMFSRFPKDSDGTEVDLGNLLCTGWNVGSVCLVEADVHQHCFQNDTTLKNKMIATFSGCPTPPARISQREECSINNLERFITTCINRYTNNFERLFNFESKDGALTADECKATMGGLVECIFDEFSACASFPYFAHMFNSQVAQNAMNFVCNLNAQGIGELAQCFSDESMLDRLLGCLMNETCDTHFNTTNFLAIACQGMSLGNHCLNNVTLRLPNANANITLATCLGTVVFQGTDVMGIANDMYQMCLYDLYHYVVPVEAPNPGAPDFEVISDVTVGVATNPADSAYQELVFSCVPSLSLNESLLYDVQWDINGQLIEAATLSQVNASAVPTLVHEAAWSTQHPSVGFHIRCRVRARFDSSGNPSLWVDSDQFFAGITARTDDDQVDEGTAVTAIFSSTIPITTSTAGSGAGFVVYIQRDNTWGCPKSVGDVRVTQGSDTISVVNNTCGFTVTAANWDTSEFSVAVTMVPDGSYGNKRDSIVAIGLRHFADSGVVDVFEGATSKPLVVTVADTDSRRRGKSCRCNNDPHCKHFDNTYFENQAPGEYILYVHGTFPYAVHVFTSYCYTPSGTYYTPACNCAVAVQAGQDVYFLSVCADDGSLIEEMTGPTCDTSILEIQQPSSNQRVLVFPTGTKVRISFQVSAYYSTINSVAVIPSAADWGASQGLCGILNDDQTDDFTLRNGTIETPTPCPWYGTCAFEFSASWSIPENSSESLWSGVANDWGANAVYTPAGESFTCANPARTGSCIFSRGSNTAAADLCVSLNRRKRAAPRPDFVPEADLTLADPPTFTGDWTAATAAAHCEAKLKEATDKTKAGGVTELAGAAAAALEDCVGDIKTSGGDTFTDATVSALVADVVEELEKSPELFEVLTAFFEEQLPCPGEGTSAGICSGHGTCTAGVCACNPGWQLGDCSVVIPQLKSGANEIHASVAILVLLPAIMLVFGKLKLMFRF